jgi:hypothetical protein
MRGDLFCTTVGRDLRNCPTAIKRVGDSPLIKALKEKFKTPAAVMAAWGLDAKLLYEEDEMDFCEELRKLLERHELGSGDLRDAIELLTTHVGDPEMVDDILDDLRGTAGAGAVDRRHHHRAGDRRHVTRDGRRHEGDRRWGRDDPEPFPGRPRPGMGPEPGNVLHELVQEGEDRRRRRASDSRQRARAHDARVAQDAALRREGRSFHDMFPGAPR